MHCTFIASAPSAQEHCHIYAQSNDLHIHSDVPLESCTYNKQCTIYLYRTLCCVHKAMTRTAMYNNYVCSVQFVQSTVLCTQNNDLQAQYFHNYVHDVLFAQSTALYTDSNDAKCKQ